MTPCLIPADKIHQRTEYLADSIVQVAHGKKIIYIPIMEGAEMFSAGLLWETLRRHQNVVSHHVTARSYEGTKSTGKVDVEISPELHELLTDVMKWDSHQIVIVDDIYETGLTIETVIKKLKAAYGIPTSCIEAVTLLHKIPEVYLRWGIPSMTRCCIKMLDDKRTASGLQIEHTFIHHVGFNVDDTIFVVGYGMDYNGQFRSLPYVGEYVP